MTPYQNFIATSRYCRWRDDLGRREQWPEPVYRLGQFWREHVEEHFPSFLSVFDARWPEIEQMIANLEIMPSMRSLMTAGPALRRDNIAGYNCAYVAVTDPTIFSEVLYVLMCGTGVGFSVERKAVQQMPSVAEEFHNVDVTITVADSKLGWANAFKQLISLLYAGQVPKVDYSRIRPAGERLKTFGGQASGPEPLISLFKFTTDVFKNAAGRKLESLECHDVLCRVGQCIVVGGVRRSAMISLSDITDDWMRKAKSGQWWVDNDQRALANNSAVYTRKPTADLFLSEWLSLVESKSGERGIFSRDAAKARFEQLGREWKPDDFVGTNPCLTGNTPILTDSGYQNIGGLAGKSCKVWNGGEWSDVKPFSTGTNPIVKVGFSDGTEIECTPHHKFLKISGFNNNKAERVEAKNLTEGDKMQKWGLPVIPQGADYSVDAYSQGFYSGDGNKNRERSWVYGEKEKCFDRLIGEKGSYQSNVDRWGWKHGPMFEKSFVPKGGSLEYRLNWFAGLLDSDGTVTRDKNGNGFQIASIDRQFLIETKRLLNTLGVRPKIVAGNEEGYRSITNQLGDEGEYFCNETKRLLIGNQDAHHLFCLGLKLERLQAHTNPPQRDARQYVKVVSVVDTGRSEETFCLTDSKRNQMTVDGLVTGNCSEILLRSKQFCNLTEAVVRSKDTEAGLKKKIRAASFLGTLQSTLTSFRFLSKQWKINTEEERLLGVSLTGIWDNPRTYNEDGLGSRLQMLKHQARDENEDVAEKLGIPASAAITCVKPSGTVSQLVDSASGIHPRYAPYYIRRVRGDKKDPVSQLLVDQGVPYETDFYNPEAYVFSFPQASDEKSARPSSSLEHLNIWHYYRKHFCEHNPSVTITVKDDEWVGVGSWVYEHFDEVGGLSFLPDQGNHTYQQAPYEAVSQEEYTRLVGDMPEVDFSRLVDYEGGDHTEGSQELACSGGQCEI